ncbi:type VI secretion system-associated FHA domain protein TagH [Inquilinus sp. Marseille-Q2685]|uniref:type VI secretion system-associated FHA domain protein TagH n=1 Tax=Inquilinus sp. Marseille-Q2685 TaxID=2866581 RepID=UPI001CE46F9B|nr:type VI secretion system-associated FHA domain protein TagH [Inquilinus sp. Marseille-Q2685]
MPETVGSDGLVEAEAALTIGRADDNGLVLRDAQQIISKHHCSIEPAEGRFVLIDRSRNGTFLNDEAEALPREVPVTLKTGDVIQIGSYRIDVIAAPGAAPAVVEADEPERTAPPAEELSFLGTVQMAPSLGGVYGRIPGGTTGRREEPLLGGIDGDLLPAPGAGIGAPLDPPEDDWAAIRKPTAYADHVPEHAVVFVQPKSGVEAIPDDWDLLAELGVAPSAAAAPAFTRVDIISPPDEPPEAPPPQPEARQDPPPRPVAEPPTGPGDDPHRAAVTAFLAACGLSPADVASADLTAVMDRAGRMLLHSVAGLHGILSARQLAKQEFGLERTMIERSGNNPLKFTLGAKEAMHTLLCVEIPGFIRGDAAVEQAFSDIKAHEVAMLAALQEALRSVCNRLSPASVERAVGQAGWHWPGTRKARGWDEYRRIFDDVVSGLENDALRIFGDDFARAYRAGTDSGRRRPEQRDTPGGVRSQGKGLDGDDE